MNVVVFCMFFGSGSYVEKAFWMIGTNFEQSQGMEETFIWERTFLEGF